MDAHRTMTNREELSRVIGQLSQDQLEEVMKVVQELLTGDQLEKLRRTPGVLVPAQWPSRFPKVEKLVVEGEPVSEQLIRERR